MIQDNLEKHDLGVVSYHTTPTASLIASQSFEADGLMHRLDSASGFSGENRGSRFSPVSLLVHRSCLDVCGKHAASGNGCKCLVC